MQIKHKLRLAVTLGLSAGALTLGLVAPSVSGAATPTGTFTFAEGAGASPNYNFPFMSCSYFSVSNINQFQNMMYRPLYWFGVGASAAYVPSLSLAATPVFANGNKTVTINMKGWKFADGQVVNAQSVMFFLNMYHAQAKNYCGYNPGFGIPDQVASVSSTSSSVVLHMKTSVNPNWFLYNYLSEITPFADAWDLKAPGTPGTCATGVYGSAATDAACTAVYDFLTGKSEAGDTSTYTDTMWQSGTDGPWMLTKFDALGNATFVPNPTYSGPVKASFAKVQLLPFSTTAAEQIALRAGKIDEGYVDPTSLTSDGTPAKPGANWSPVASKFNIVVGAPWSVDYAAYNFNPKSPESKYLDQLYIRQVLQMTVDQPLMIKQIDKGYGYDQINPMPPTASVAVTGAGVSKVDPYPYNPKKAAAILKAHGWVTSGSFLACAKPGSSASECGPGISKGDVLTITILYGSGIPSLQTQVSTEVSEWSSLGIDAQESGAPFNSVVADCSANASSWSVCLWGAGWIYAPDYYPSGESLFAIGASFNIGDYKNTAMTASINSTTFGPATLAKYANLAAQQLPVLYQPNAVTPAEIIKTLKSSIGFTPNPLENFMPEYYHF
jgi:peptide/nickel transport system substrate-binding protein